LLHDESQQASRIQFEEDIRIGGGLGSIPLHNGNELIDLAEFELGKVAVRAGPGHRLDVGRREDKDATNVGDSSLMEEGLKGRFGRGTQHVLQYMVKEFLRGRHGKGW